MTAVVEGAFVGNFDPDTYKSDRKDQKVDSMTVVARGDQSRLQKTMDEARIIGESQNFTRDLVNEPSNRMTPTILAERARKMAQETGLQSRSVWPRETKRIEDGGILGRRPGLRRTTSSNRFTIRTSGCARDSGTGPRRKRRHF